MSSRQEEKERRRQERLAAEREAAERTARRRRLGLAGAGVLIVAAAAVAVIALTAGGEKSKKKPDNAAARMLDAKVQQSARAAGCSVQTFPTSGRNHVEGTVKYATNPPTSGNHNPTPASDGIYDPGGTPQVEKLVHALEHGRVELQYRRGSPRSVLAQLEGLMKEPGANGRQPGYNQLLYENTTNMPYEVAATAWTRLLACPKFQGAPTLAALRAFRDAYTDKAPEFVPVPE